MPKLRISLFIFIFLAGSQVLRAGDFARHYWEILEIPDSIAQDCEQVWHLYNLGQQCQDQPDLGLHYLALAEKISRDNCAMMHFIKIKEVRGQLFRIKGDITASLAEYIEALPNLEQSRELASTRRAWFLVNYGNELYRIALFNEAFAVYHKAQKIFTAHRDNFGLSVVQINKGLCALGYNTPEEALMRFDSAIALRQNLNRPHLMAHAYLYRSRAYLAMKNLSLARASLYYADTLIGQSEPQDFFPAIQRERAQVLMSLGSYTEARAILKSLAGVDFSEQSTDDIKILCESFRRTGPLDSLIFYTELGLEKSRNIGNYLEQISFLRQLIEIEQERGHFERSLKLQEQIYPLFRKNLDQRAAVFRSMKKSQEELIRLIQKNRNLISENAQKQDIISIQRLSIISGLIFLGLVLLASFFLFRLYRKLKRTRSHLAALGQRVVTAGDALNVGMLYLDHNGRLKYFNKRAEELYRSIIDHQLLLNQHFPSQLKNKMIRENWLEILRTASEKQSWQQTLIRETDEGTRYFTLSLSSIFHNQNYQGLVAMISDITSEQQRNMNLANQTRDLELANKAKERVISLLAHDLKEGVIAPLELVKVLKDESALSHEERQDYLELIFRSLSKTKALLFQTLDWVKEQKSQFNPRLKSVILQKLTQDIWKGLEEQCRQKQLRPIVDISPELRVTADPEMLRSVMLNLIQNAIKYSPPAGALVRVSAKSIDQNKVRINVIDQGTGLSVSEMNHILHRSVDSSRTGTAGEKGSGIGLNMTQDLLNLMGSSLQIESEIGRGTQFYFDLSKAKIAAV